MDKLKSFIDQNRSAFDEEPLPLGHLERFERKLPKPSRKRLYWRIGGMVAAVAASFLLLLFLRPQLQTDKAEGNDLSGLASEEVRGEIRDLCQYYQMRVDGILAQMEEISKRERTPGVCELLAASRRVVHDNQAFERKVLPTLPDSGEGIYTVTLHYTNSLNGLSFMLRKMEQIAGNDKETIGNLK